MNLTKITFTVDSNITLRESLKYEIKEMKITALPPINKPVNGILSAWRIPPKAASLNAQRAVILSIVNLFWIMDAHLF
jgi:hypothetical protein